MFFTSTTAADLDDQSLEYFEEHESESGGLPYFQVLTHPNEAVVKVKKGRPWGIYISTENAEAINFAPDANWKPVTFFTVENEGFANAVLSIDDDERQAYAGQGLEVTEHTGFVSNTLMFHLIYQSQSEVERKDSYQGKPSFKFVGLRWDGDEAHRDRMAELLAERDSNNDPTHRWCQRYMFILVGADGQPLHDGVITWRGKGGAGGAFSMEMNELFKDLNDAYAKGKGSSRLKLFQAKNRHAGDSRSFVRLAMSFDLYKGGKDRAPFLVPVARVLPTGNPGETKVREVTRGKDEDRTVKLYPSLLIHDGKTEMLVSQASELGQRIRDAIAEYASFPLPMQGKEMAEGDALLNGDVAYSGKGFIDAATLNLNQDGSATALFMTEKGSVPLVIPAEHIGAIDHVNLSVQGVIPADGGPVAVTAWEGEEVTPVAAAEPVAEQGSLVAAGDW